MKMNGAQLIIKLLERQGVSLIAGIPGGTNLPLYDALIKSPIQHVLTRHEQGAGFVAQGIARSSGQVGVCLACSGPGTTNLLTAIADAHLDSIPLIALTGQVATDLIGTDAFQECDTYGLMVPITKHNWLVRNIEDLLTIVPEAFRIALSGRPGPVSIDVPKDVQLQTIEFEQWPEPAIPDSLPQPEFSDIKSLGEMLRASKRPLLMVGGGVTHSGAAKDLVKFAEHHQIPTVASFMGLSIMPSAHPLFLGMLGMHGAPYTNMVLDECDLLIGAGVRFDDRATGRVSRFCPNAAVVHIDIDKSELGKIKTPTLAINSDVGAVLRASLNTHEKSNRKDWLTRITNLKMEHCLVMPKEENLFQPYRLLMALANLVDPMTNIITDVGQHQMWVAQVFPFVRPRQWISSGGLGTMGFGLPAAIGAALRQPQHMALCISGDGSIMMNIQELDTAVEHNLNLKIVIMNNRNLGLVRQQQTLFYGKRLTALGNQRRVDFVALAQAMGVNGFNLSAGKNPLQSLQRALNTEGPCLINVDIEEKSMVFPMVPPGAANSDMIMEQKQ